MALSRKKKEEIVNIVSEAAKNASAIVFADFLGLKTKDMTEFRKIVKAAGGNVKIVKKTLAAMGLKEMMPQEILTRPGGIAMIWFNALDIASAFKTVWQFSSQNEALKILGGYSPDMGMIDERLALFIAKLPPYEVLLGQLVGILRWPIVGFVRVLGEIQRSKR